MVMTEQRDAPASGNISQPDVYGPLLRKAQGSVRSVASLLGEERGNRLYAALRKPYRFLERSGRTAYGFAYDCNRYLRHSFTLADPVSKAHLAYFIRMRFHTFEKGLSIKEPRPGFGEAALGELLAAVRTYVDNFGEDYLSDTVLNVLTEYNDYNVARGIESPHEVDALLRNRTEASQSDIGGTVTMSASDREFASSVDFTRFVNTRHSVRQYDPTDVDPEKLKRAIACGQRAPSVCNRQAGRVHIFTGADDCAGILKFQDGHRGFGHDLRCVFVVTADLGSYYKPGERFESWVDGGLFCMSLIYGLHAEGLGTCCLNWNVSPRRDQKMRRWAGIPDNEVVITMLAVGNTSGDHAVAQSPRRPQSEIATWH